MTQTMRAAALAVCGLLVAAVLAGCTPKPDSVDPTVERFIAALVKGNREEAAQLADKTDDARAGIDAAFDGLQAEGVDATIISSSTSGDVGEAIVAWTWHLPRGRSFLSEAPMALSRTEGTWSVRYQPNMWHRNLGHGQRMELRTIAGTRAKVVGSDGSELLTPGTRQRLLLDATATGALSSASVIAELVGDQLSGGDPQARPSGEDIFDMAKAVSGEYSVLLLASDTPQATMDRLRELPGVRLNPEAAMIRPDPSFAPDILRRVETVVAEELSGTDGWKVSAVNENGAEISVLTATEPETAPAIRVGLDRTIQQAAQDAVNSRTDQAMMVVVRPSTGDILAVAQTPAADQAGDIALAGMFPPGSTFKIVTAAAGIQDGTHTPSTIVPCPGTMEIGHRIIPNYNGFSLGNVPLEQAFAASCNTTFGDMAYRMANDGLTKTAAGMGLGLDYRIPGMTTITGSVPIAQSDDERTEDGFGQGSLLVSPLGMALLAATVAEGERVTPQLIEGKTTFSEADQPEAREISPETYEQVRQMMRAVVTSGTARGMSNGDDMFGKTGEAEVADGSHAWFAGYKGDLAFATLIVKGGGSQYATAITDAFFSNLPEGYNHGEMIPITTVPVEGDRPTG